MTVVLASTPGPQGPPGLNPRGQWLSTVAYSIGDSVYNGGAAWAALQPSQGVVPGTAPLQWTLVMQSQPMVGSNGVQAGAAGTVPAPGADAEGRFLRGDGTWAAGNISGLTYNGSGQLVGYTEDGIAYVLAYNTDGTLNTITGGGSVGTVSYNAGAATGISYT